MTRGNKGYDFTKNRLGLRLRVMGGISVPAGALLVFCAVLLAGVEQGAGSHARLVGAPTAVAVGVAGVCLLALGVLLLVLPSRPALAGPTRAVAVVLLVPCAALLAIGLADGNERLAVALGSMGAAMAGGILPLIGQGRVGGGES